MSKIANQLQELVNQKKALANNLTVKGQVSSEDETLNELVPKVLNIASGDTKLGIKEITEDGIYKAYEDNLDGYSQVNVNILGNCDFIATFNGKTSANYNPKNIKMLSDVPDYAFINEKINEADLTKSKSVGIAGFRQSDLTKIIAPNPLLVKSYAFYSNGNAEGDVIISEEQNIIEQYSFYSCNKLNIHLHDNITEIGNYAFYNCMEFAPDKLPTSLKIIGNYAFFSNIKLKINEIPAGVTSIGNYAFRTNVIENLKIHDACTSIGSHCFRYSSTLETVEIGNGIKTIGIYCFANTQLKKLIMHKLTPPTLGGNAFSNCPLEIIEVPSSALETYKKATNWSTYADIMVGIEGE